MPILWLAVEYTRGNWLDFAEPTTWLSTGSRQGTVAWRWKQRTTKHPDYSWRAWPQTSPLAIRPGGTYIH